MKNRIMLTVCIAVFTVSLTACGEKTTDDVDTAGQNTETAAYTDVLSTDETNDSVSERSILTRDYLKNIDKVAIFKG